MNKVNGQSISRTRQVNSGRIRLSAPRPVQVTCEYKYPALVQACRLGIENKYLFDSRYNFKSNWSVQKSDWTVGHVLGSTQVPFKIAH